MNYDDEFSHYDPADSDDDEGLVWESYDGDIQVFKEIFRSQTFYILTHQGQEVMPPQVSFRAVSKYIWAEFIID